MPDKTPFQIQQSGNDEVLSATVIERMEPEEIDRLLAYLQDPREYVTEH
nr:MAG TPA: hypothetical protein [Caudoviricetes sp.]